MLQIHPQGWGMAPHSPGPRGRNLWLPDSHSEGLTRPKSLHTSFGRNWPVFTREKPAVLTAPRTWSPASAALEPSGAAQHR